MAFLYLQRSGTLYEIKRRSTGELPANRPPPPAPIAHRAVDPQQSRPIRMADEIPECLQTFPALRYLPTYLPGPTQGPFHTLQMPLCLSSSCPPHALNLGYRAQDARNPCPKSLISHPLPE